MEIAPVHLEILLHYHCNVEPYPFADAGCHQNAVRLFLQEKLIEPTPDRNAPYRTTSRGAAHIRALCDLPFPVQRWTHPLTNEPIP